MPIRLNLLAEQQAAEEERRRDPVKRAWWVAGIAVLLVVLWIVRLEFKSAGLRSDLTAHEARWKQIEPAFLQASNNFRESLNLRRKLDALARYGTNRFLWSPVLNALQHSTRENVRLISLSGKNNLSSQSHVLYTTNLYAPAPKKKWWLFGPPISGTNLFESARSALTTVTNTKPEFVKYHSDLQITPITLITNPLQIAAKFEIIKPQTVTEQVALTLRARDYGNPPGDQVDKFHAAVTNAPLLRQWTSGTNSSVDRSIQPRPDPTDLVNPNGLYIEFVIQSVFPERVRSNE